MGTKINLVGIVSDTYAMAQQFYQAVFGFKVPSYQIPFPARLCRKKLGIEGAFATVGDGYLGININPRRLDNSTSPARPAGLDHFGVEVDDAEAFADRLKEKYPACRSLKRPNNRPFAGITTHDPDGNVFDISERFMENHGEIITDSTAVEHQDRYVSHFALRTMNPEKLAEFYVDLLDLPLANKATGDPNYYITDGRMTLVLMHWNIEDFDGQGIIRPGPNHIGIKVEDIEKLKSDVCKAAGDNPSLSPDIVDMGPEGVALRDLLGSSVPYANFLMSDNNKVLIAVHDN